MELAARIQALLTERTGGPVRVEGVRPLPGGACQDLFAVDVALGDAPSRRFVLRSDARQGLPGSIGREQEYPVVQAARRVGVPTPEVHWLTKDLVREGAHAYFMDWAEGVALGGKVTRDPRLQSARERLPQQLAQALADVHRISPESDPDLPLEGADDPVGHALQIARTSLDELPRSRPALELVYRWLEQHAPEASDVTLVHGDFRTGNFLVTPDGLQAVLDWEFAHWGVPEQDAAWFCLRDWRFNMLQRPAGGLTDRRTFYQAYAEASGRALDPAAVHWWEVYGNVGWASGSLWQTERYLSGELDFELLVIGRRWTEMAWEAMRLIEEGPPSPEAR